MNDEEEVSLKEEQDKSKNDEISEDNSKHLIRQENTAESTRITTMEDTDDTQSRDLVDDRVAFDILFLNLICLCRFMTYFIRLANTVTLLIRFLSSCHQESLFKMIRLTNQQVVTSMRTCRNQGSSSHQFPLKKQMRAMQKLHEVVKLGKC